MFGDNLEVTVGHIQCRSSGTRTCILFGNVRRTGAVYLDDCPIQRFIPIYLIVGGAFGLWETLCGFIQSLCNLKDPDGDRAVLSALCKVSEAVVGCFMTAWFIAGMFSLLFLCLSVSPSLSLPSSLSLFVVMIGQR